MISIGEALRIVLESADRLPETEVDYLDAYGLVLAEDVIADIDIPPFDKSAMDGYAVRSQDLRGGSGILRVLTTAAAGSFPHEKLSKGECIKIMTGAPLPGAADAVVMVEETEELADGWVRLPLEVVPGQNICRRGEDIGKDEVVLKRGTLIGGPEIAVLSSVGRCRVRVVRRPVLEMLSTGNEIVEPGATLEKGKIRNSNGSMLLSLASAAGCHTRYLGIGPDSERELGELISGSTKADLLLISGGVSVGDYDLIPSLLKNVGAEILFHGVRVKPGKPLLFARKDRCLIFGIPGNPVSNLTTFVLFVRPAIKKMMGRVDYEHALINARLTSGISQKGDRAYILPSRCRIEDGRHHVTPLKLNGSADIVGCAGCDCLIVLEEGRKILKAGEIVSIIPFDR